MWRTNKPRRRGGWDRRGLSKGTGPGLYALLLSLSDPPYRLRESLAVYPLAPVAHLGRVVAPPRVQPRQDVLCRLEQLLLGLDPGGVGEGIASRYTSVSQGRCLLGSGSGGCQLAGPFRFTYQIVS